MRHWMRPVGALALLLLVGACAASQGLEDLPGIIRLDGHPFSALPLEDGSLLVSLSNGEDRGGAIALLQPQSGRLAMRRAFAVPGNPAGLALSHDGRKVALAAGRTTLLLDRQMLLSGQGDPIIARVRNQAGALYVAFSPDDRLLAISEENADRVMLLPLQDGRSPTEIDVGRAPVGLAFSPEGNWLYALSEAATGGTGTCARSSGGGAIDQGTVSTIMVAPGSVPRLGAVARVGCSPVRIVLSPDGTDAFVSLRGEDRVATFSTETLREGRGLRLATAEVGPAPVGLLLSADARHLQVADSDRFSHGNGGSLSCLAVASAGMLGQPVGFATGQFPRELARLPDGRTVVTLFGSNAIQLLPAGAGCS